jgi:hypothetical protein
LRPLFFLGVFALKSSVFQGSERRGPQASNAWKNHPARVPIFGKQKAENRKQRAVLLFSGRAVVSRGGGRRGPRCNT